MTDPWQALGRVMAEERRQDAIRQQERRERQRDMDNINTGNYGALVKAAARKSQSIFNKYKGSVNAARENVMIPDAGRQKLISDAYDTAQTELRELEKQVNAAAAKSKASLLVERNKRRPAVDPATHETRARQYQTLVSAGIPLDTIIQEAAGDPVGIRVLQSEAPIYARAQNPNDSEAHSQYNALLSSLAYDAFGPEYQEYEDRLSAADDALYYARVSLSQTKDALREGPDTELVVADSVGQALSA